MRSIKIGHINYRIKKVNHLVDGGEVFYGQIHYKKSNIKLARKMSEQHERQTLWHEILHAIAYHAGTKMDERDIEVLASGIMQVINDNPKMGEKVDEN